MCSDTDLWTNMDVYNAYASSKRMMALTVFLNLFICIHVDCYLEIETRLKAFLSWALSPYLSCAFICAASLRLDHMH